ncbi:uncharacterized protein LOC135118702 [Helicoverpa armigera]|uniref:uncharacterized protein LOC135118702 n=1 Tax=Helicoverpa armigera TaxID=29058 RepID=UPI003083B75F
MAEWSIDVAVVAEPYFIPARDNWLGCADGLVAIIGGTLTDPSRGRGWVAAVSGGIVIVGAFSPNKSLADFEGFLVELGAVRLPPSPSPRSGAQISTPSHRRGDLRSLTSGEVLEEGGDDRSGRPESGLGIHVRAAAGRVDSGRLVR